MTKRFTVGAVALMLALVSVQPGRTQRAASASVVSVDLAAVQGFGDRQNSVAWAMVWWQGKLYVGTGRSTQCVQDATLAYYHPDNPQLYPYPDPDPEIRCTSSPQNLPLQAEIWRWTPETNAWERVYQSPNDVPLDPDHPDTSKYIARDIGFRTMAIFKESDGTEALYVGGVSARSFNASHLPPPRILRTADGEHWDAVPQDSGLLAATSANGFRSMTVHEGRLYVVASDGLLGQGPVYEAADPAGGNDNFRQITPDGMSLYEMASYNGFLYLGSGDKSEPFTVWKTMANGTLPYSFTPVVTNGAYRQTPTAHGIVAMQVFKEKLYFGTDFPAELYRINQDDSWDVVVGDPRQLPGGCQQKRALSGMGTAFGWPYNLHIWRMGVHGDRLYVGTFDGSTPLREQFPSPSFQDNLGFDLYSSVDGQQFSQITHNGFGDKFSVGARQLVSTPYGLFIGSANQYYGLRLWRLTSSTDGPSPQYQIYLPAVLGPGGSCPNAPQ